MSANNPQVVLVAGRADVGVCRRCFKECCNCVDCVARKGGQRDLCNGCYQATKPKEAAS
jgi:hypothetical protein